MKTKTPTTNYATESWPIDRPKPYEKNPRKNDAAVKAVAESINRFGFRQPIIVDADGVVIAGHTRLKAAAVLGLAEVPVHVAADLTSAQVKALRLADNKAAELAEWDNDLLSQELLELQGMDFDISGLGFSEDELDALDCGGGEEGDAEPGIDKAAELNKKWCVETGDLWAIGDHRLVCGDSTKASDLARLMGEDKATCVFTDPPYGVSIGKKNEMLNTFQKAGRCLASLDLDDMAPEDLKVMLLSAFRTCRPHLADDCSVFVCSPQGGGLGMMMMMMQEADLEVRHILNWVKNSPTFSMGRLDYDYQHEPILFTWTKTHKRKKEGQWQTSLWTADKPRACDLHPTMKPVELPVNAIQNHTDQGDVVLDIFGGSGTTMVASQNTGRRGRLVEISPAFCAVILERMSEAFPDIKIAKA